jgi:hypothetical protein
VVVKAWLGTDAPAHLAVWLDDDGSQVEEWMGKGQVVAVVEPAQEKTLATGKSSGCVFATTLDQDIRRPGGSNREAKVFRHPDKVPDKIPDKVPDNAPMILLHRYTSAASPR